MGLIFPIPQKSYNARTYHSLMCSVPNRRTGASIPCLHIHSSGKPRPNVIFYFHGNSEDVGMCFSLGFMFFEKYNADIVLVEYPGYGIYAGEPSEEGILSDAEAVLAYFISAKGYAVQNVFLVGRSMGSGSAVHLASRFDPRAKTGPTAGNVGGVVLLTPFTSIQEVGEDKAGYILSKILPNIFDNASKIGRVTAPTLIIHGKRDEIVPWSHSDRLHRGCATRYKHLVLHEDMNHNGFDLERHVFRPITDFFGCYRPDFLLRENQMPYVKENHLSDRTVSAEKPYSIGVVKLPLGPRDTNDHRVLNPVQTPKMISFPNMGKTPTRPRSLTPAQRSQRSQERAHGWQLHQNFDTKVIPPPPKKQTIPLMYR
eukprot:TRINITY_DN10552_c0_g1_i1.p1 TRINITY_DN10552_c0_g1~~TRINITY_DN10552_c0_g1_i1.p1  ORF type:complete len:370 (+),score=40.39 TRINITY_DN10552_c0_g1_i1:3-1112(+)